MSIIGQLVSIIAGVGLIGTWYVFCAWFLAPSIGIWAFVLFFVIGVPGLVLMARFDDVVFLFSSPKKRKGSRYI